MGNTHKFKHVFYGYKRYVNSKNVNKNCLGKATIRRVDGVDSSSDKSAESLTGTSDVALAITTVQYEINNDTNSHETQIRKTNINHQRTMRNHVHAPVFLFFLEFCI